MSRREVGPVIVSFSLVCRLFPDLSFPDSRLSYFFFFKGSGAPRDLPSSPPRRSPDLRRQPKPQLADDLGPHVECGVGVPPLLERQGRPELAYRDISRHDHTSFASSRTH